MPDSAGVEAGHCPDGRLCGWVGGGGAGPDGF